MAPPSTTENEPGLNIGSPTKSRSAAIVIGAPCGLLGLIGCAMECNTNPSIVLCVLNGNRVAPLIKYPVTAPVAVMDICTSPFPPVTTSCADDCQVPIICNGCGMMNLNCTSTSATSNKPSES